MIKNKEEWLDEVDYFIGKMRLAEDIETYEVMVEFKKFLLSEKEGPQDLAQDLLEVMDAGFMKKDASEIADSMKRILYAYEKNQMKETTKKNQLENATKKVEQKLVQENQKQKMLDISREIDLI